MVVVWSVLILLIFILAASYVCYRLCFSVPKQTEADLFRLPDTEQYAPYREAMTQMVQTVLALPYEDVWIRSDDGLHLHGKYYAGRPGAPVQIMMHGYKSGAERDFCGGAQIAVQGGYHVLLVDQRAHGKSEGRCLTFGIQERYDCRAWVNYALGRFGADTKILLYGVSMGAATVLMAGGLNLPRNVVGIVADCGYSSPAAIIRKVIRDQHLHFPGLPVDPPGRETVRRFRPGVRHGHGCAGALRHSCAADSWRGRPLRPLRHGARKLCALRSAQQAAAGRAGRGSWAELHGGQGSVSGRARVVPPVRAGLTLHTGKNQPHRE